MTNPDLIFLDEPTSGLDAFTARSTLENMKELTKKGLSTSDVLWNVREGVAPFFSRAIQTGPLFGNVSYFPCSEAPTPLTKQANKW